LFGAGSFFICQDREKKVSKFEQSGLTEEELLAKQEELFAASRAKFQSGQQ
jgi:down-regulator of transcription 1